MKKSMILTGLLLAVLFSGCSLKSYQDTTNPNYATVQLVPKSKTLFFADDYYSALHDLNNVCDENKESFLGAVKTDSDTPSRLAKVAAEKPLYIYTAYVIESDYGTEIIYNEVALRPQKNRHYVIEYERKKINFFRTADQYSYYMLEDGKKYKIPANRIKYKFTPRKACKKKNFNKF